MPDAGDLPPLIALVQADIASFLDKLSVVDARLNELTSQESDATIGADISDFESKMAVAKATLDAFAGARATATADVDTAPAMAKLGALEAAVKAMPSWASAMQGNLGYDFNVERWRQMSGAQGGQFATNAQLAEMLAAISAQDRSGLPTGALAAALGGAGAGGGGGGLAGLAAGAAAGGGGRPSLLASVLPALLWGGGSGIAGLGGLAGMGSLGSLAGFGPEHALMLAAGIGGSAFGGLLGGGLLAGGAAGTAAVGMGTDLAGIGQAAGDIKTTYTNLQALDSAIQQYGKNSTQAAAAQTTLNAGLASFSSIAQGAVVQAAQTAQGFVKLFDAATGAAEKTGAEIITQAIKVGEQFLPTIGKYAAENMGILQKDIQPLFQWIDTTGLGIFTNLEKKFQSDLPTAIHALTQGFELFARTIDLAAQSTGPLLTHINDFLTRMNGADWGRWSGEVEKLIGDFRMWDAFVVILVRDIAALFHADTSGTVASIVTYLTEALDKLHQWEVSTTGSTQLATIFAVHKQQIMDLLPVIGNLIEQYGKLFFTVAPYAVRIMDALVVTFGDFLKLIEAAGPLGDYAIALTLIAGKLQILGPLLKAAFATDVVQGFMASLSGAAATAPADTAAIDTAIAGVGTTATATADVVKTALIGTGIGAAIVAFGVAADLMLSHWQQVMSGMAAAVSSAVTGVEHGFNAIIDAWNNTIGAISNTRIADIGIGGGTAGSGGLTAAQRTIVYGPGNSEQYVAPANATANQINAIVAAANQIQSNSALQTSNTIAEAVIRVMGTPAQRNQAVPGYSQYVPGIGNVPIEWGQQPGSTTGVGTGAPTLASILGTVTTATTIPSGAGVPPTGPTTASQAANTAAQQAAAAAQAALAAHIAAITQEGQQTMARLVADIHSTNLASLRSAVIQTHSKGFEDLIKSLDSIHTAEGDKLASQLTGLEKESVTARNAELKAIDAAEATARVNATVTAMDAIQAAQLKAATDQTNASIQFANDANKMANDAAATFATLTADASAINTAVSNSIVSAINDQTAIITDRANAQVSAIQDNSQLLTDQMALQGLTGTALAAAQAQVAYDIEKQTDDARVAADQLALDTAKQTIDARVNADTIALAQQKAADDAAIAAATQHADQVTMIQDQNVNTAQEQLDTASINAQSQLNSAEIANAVAAASQDKALQQATAAWVQSATNAQTQAVGAGGTYTTAYTNAVNQANSAIQYASAQLAATQQLAQVLEGLLSATLATDTGQGNQQIALLEQQLATDMGNANIALAGFQATIQQLNEANTLAQATATATTSTAGSTAATAAATTPAAAAPIVVTVVTQIDGQQVALTTTPLIRQEILRTIGRQTQNVFGGSAGRLIPS